MSAIFKFENAFKAEPVRVQHDSLFPVSNSLKDMEKENVIQRQDAWMQQCWNKTMSEKLGTPDRYSHIAVLIVHWVHELDGDLNCWKEVEELDSMFQNDFHYRSRIVQLDNKPKPPQAQLDKDLMDFVYDFDGPHKSHLLLVYYTGHGFCKNRNGGEELFVSGTAREQHTTDDSSFPPHASWTVAEGPLDRARADTLTILDCCCASNVMKGVSESIRSYQLMAATGKNLTTPRPGPRSYTRALIDSLKLLLQNRKQPFSTFDLNQEIIRQRKWNTSPQLYNRRHETASRQIYIAPLDETTVMQERQRARSAGYLSLRINFKDNSTFSPEEITTLASEMSALPKKTGIGISEIEWIGFEPTRDSLQLKHIVRAYWMMLGAITRWQQRQKRQRRRKAVEELTNGARSPKRRSTAPYALESPVDEKTNKSLPAPPLTPSVSSRGVTPST